MIKKSKIIGFVSIFLLGVTPLVTTGATVYADDVSDTNQKKEVYNEDIQVNTANHPMDTYDQYVTVQNNKFVLKLPNDFIASNDSIEQAQTLIKTSNEAIEKNNLTIDVDTKIASSNNRFTRGVGVNKVDWHWNYARVFLKKDDAKLFLGTSAGTVGVVATFLSIPTGAAFSLAVGLVALGIKIGQINDGIWFDYNYVNGVLTRNWGWQ